MSCLSHGFLVILLINFALTVPVKNSDEFNNVTTDNVEVESSTSDVPKLDNSEKDLYVIKSVVYEIGILTDSVNDTDFDNRTHEQIDVTFFDPAENETSIDLSNIPVPIQTNVSGVSITGIVSADFGNIHLLKNGTATVEGSRFPWWPDKEVKVTQNVVTSDKETSSSILSNLPDILGLKELHLGHKNDTDSSEETS